MTDVERWRPVVGYEGRYEVSDHGRVRSLDRYARTRSGQRRVPGKVLALTPTSEGYRCVNLSADGTARVCNVHVLVLTAFKGPRPDGMEGLHADDDGAHNHHSNLRWGTPSDNARDAVTNGGHRHSKRTHCKFDHKLGAPNVSADDAAKDRRNCLACERGGARVRNGRRAGLTLDHRTEADYCYARIMAGETGYAPRRKRTRTP